MHCKLKLIQVDSVFDYFEVPFQNSSTSTFNVNLHAIRCMVFSIHLFFAQSQVIKIAKHLPRKTVILSKHCLPFILALQIELFYINSHVIFHQCRFTVKSRALFVIIPVFVLLVCAAQQKKKLRLCCRDPVENRCTWRGKKW